MLFLSRVNNIFTFKVLILCLFFKNVVAFGLFRVHTCLGISLRMKKQSTENNQTNNNIIFSFFIYLLRKAGTQKAGHHV